jgi:hypothetical protein
MVQDELQQIYQPVEMNEKIFMGKVMEIKGRSLVVSREAFKWRSEPTNHVAEIFWEKLQLQRAIQGGLRATPIPSPATPTRSTRATRCVSPTPSCAPSNAAVPTVNPLAKAKAKAAPAPDLPVMEVPDPLHDVMEIHSDEETPAWKAIAGLCFP